MLQGDNSTANLLRGNLCLVDRNHGRGDTNTETGDDTTDNEQGNTVRSALEAVKLATQDYMNNMNKATYIDPIIHRIDENWIAVTREYLSAMKLELSAPTREPKGMAQVMAP